MDPTETGAKYDRIAGWWLGQMADSTYGLSALERAIRFSAGGGRALDFGCGCECRFIRALIAAGFHCTGLDISPKMISLASARVPTASFVAGNICSWPLPDNYDLITAWDSTFHLPPAGHEPVLVKLCSGLSPGGILLFTCGGGDESGTVSGSFGGEEFEYSTLGVPDTLRILRNAGCSVIHLEYDQYPENHLYIIAKKQGR